MNVHAGAVLDIVNDVRRLDFECSDRLEEHQHVSIVETERKTKGGSLTSDTARDSVCIP